MSFINRLLMVGLLSVGLAAATTAQAGNQLFEGSWSVKAFGNECVKSASGQSQCLQPPEDRTGESEFYEAWGIPGGVQCNPNQPRCPFQSTPTSGMGGWEPLGGTEEGISPFCTPWNQTKWNSATVRPAKGATYRTTMFARVVPPLYRNYQFFTTSTKSALPGSTACSAISTGATPGGKGLVQAGVPVTGTWNAVTTGTQLGGFSFASAPSGTGAGGFRVTGAVGEFEATYPYVYSYSYANLRNDQGVFGPGQGPGAFNLRFGSPTYASIVVKQGAAKFGGTMRMLGAYTNKACYFRQGGCSLGENDWRYEAVGATAYTASGVVTAGYSATYKAYYYHSVLMQKSTVSAEGQRFPWTTGNVTLTATGRGPHKTVHYTQGFDNRNTATPSGKGTIKLVTPVLTRWLQPCCKFETGGVGSLRIKFVPEPQAWLMLVAGVSLLGVATRIRRR